MNNVILQETYKIPDLPLKFDFDTIRVMKSLNRATRSLAEVKGRASAIPNQGILIDTLSLQEAKQSSEIENIVTTNDELFRNATATGAALKGPSKEVAMYSFALRRGYENTLEKGAITNRALIEMFRILKNRDDGFRKLPGTALEGPSKKIVYVPPQNAADIEAHMARLETYINEDSQLDPLVRMAIIHHQFESIHPFPDGNGRVGRMLNVLFLTQSGLLDIPILYLSRGINRTKSEYYRLLQSVRDDGNWEDWVVYLLDLVHETAQMTLDLIEGIRTQMASFKQTLRSGHAKIYSQDLINNVFRHPYTRIEFAMDELQVSRPTATSYLEQMANDENLPITKIVGGRNNYYVNVGLVALLNDIQDPP